MTEKIQKRYIYAALMFLFFKEMSLPETNQIPITWPWNCYTQNIVTRLCEYIWKQIAH